MRRTAAGVQVGEHDSCGPGNLAVSGFTYNPETFMAARIGVYNISWRDMGVPTLEKMMDIVQVCIWARVDNVSDSTTASVLVSGGGGADAWCCLCEAAPSAVIAAPAAGAAMRRQHSALAAHALTAAQG